MAWGVGGWLLFPVPAAHRPGGGHRRCASASAAQLRTTFASGYAKEISLAAALQPDMIKDMASGATRTKYLICPQR